MGDPGSEQVFMLPEFVDLRHYPFQFEMAPLMARTAAAMSVACVRAVTTAIRLAPRASTS